MIRKTIALFVLAAVAEIRLAAALQAKTRSTSEP
jgi:hypothetical protein